MPMSNAGIRVRVSSRLTADRVAAENMLSV
jgi:hypothetical protein